jgi:hypothetical protein
MIDGARMMELLLNACPSFEPDWQEFLDDWADNPEPLPYFVALSAFARHLSLVMARGNDQVLRQVFATVERLIGQGDEYVQNAATIGLIEDLQNSNLHRGTTPEQFIPYLLPQSRRWWRKIDILWTGQSQVPADDDGA